MWMAETLGNYLRATDFKYRDRQSPGGADNEQDGDPWYRPTRCWRLRILRTRFQQFDAVRGRLTGLMMKKRPIAEETIVTENCRRQVRAGGGSGYS